MSLVEVRDLRVLFSVANSSWFSRKKRFVHAVDGVNFDIAEGETLGLVGESGCGKSTTGRAVTRLINATSGSVFFENRDLLALEGGALKEARKNFQMVFQNPFSSLDPRMTVSAILEEPLLALTSLTARERLRRVAELMEEVQLSPSFLRRYPHEFSGGQRQRINIARALAVSPKFIVADEPVSALDVSIQAQIINLLLDLQKRRKIAFLFIAHDLSVVKTLSHRVAVMYLGRIVEMGETVELYQRPKHPYTQALLSAAPIADPRAERSRARIPLIGEIPSPIDVPKGCHFHPRCPYATERCRVEQPKFRKINAVSSVACHHVEKWATVESVA